MANNNQKTNSVAFLYFRRGGGELDSLTKKRMACGTRLGAHYIEGYSHNLSRRLIEHSWQATSEYSYDVFHLDFIRKCLQDVGFPAVLIINTKIKVVVV